MSQKSKYILYKSAENDLFSILEYSNEIWGLKKAINYINKIKKHLEFLVKNPKSGTDVSYILPFCRKSIIEKHIIFYQIKDKNIEILRILHQSMDIDNSLNKYH